MLCTIQVAASRRRRLDLVQVTLAALIRQKSDDYGRTVGGLYKMCYKLLVYCNEVSLGDTTCLVCNSGYQQVEYD